MKLVRLRNWNRKSPLCLAMANLFCNLHTMCALFFLPMFALYVLQTSAMQAGLITSMSAIVGLFMGPVWGKLIGRTRSAKQAYLIGTAIRVALTVVFVLILNESCSIYVIYGLMFVSGFYNSQTGVTFAAAPQLMLKEENRMQGNAVIQICQNVGSTVAVALYTLIIGIFGVVKGIHIAFVVALVFSLLALGVGLLMENVGKEESTR